MIRPIWTLPQNQKFLRLRAKKIHTFPGEAPRVIRDLRETWDTVAAYGIAAPQIGESFRIFVYRPHDDEQAQPIAIINPKILRAEGEIADYDGCLSVPGIYGTTRRAASIEITGWDTNGQKIRQHFEGFTARIIQHEIDHLEGVLFIDRIDDMDSLYSLEPAQDAQPDDAELEERPLAPEWRRLVEQHRMPLPPHALTW